MGKTVKDVALLSDLLLNPEGRKALPEAGLVSFLASCMEEHKCRVC
jgi:hypothetical protein